MLIFKGFSQSFKSFSALPRKALGCLGIACRRQMEIDRVTALVEGMVEIDPLPYDLYVGFIDPPAARNPGSLPIPAEPLLHLRCKMLNPAVYRCVVDIDAALIEHLLQVR